MILPPKPPCWPQMGIIKCSPRCDLDCAAARQFWARCQLIADMESNPMRTKVIGELTKTHGASLAQRIRLGAHQLIKEAA